jgi:predicted nucleotidyltransferase
MRLSDETQKEIVRLFKQYFSDGKLYLFGSRVDSQAKGGDIDLLCEFDGDPDFLINQKLAFLIELDQAIGEQQVDLVLYRPTDNPHSEIAVIAKKTGVRLV